jgi:prolyl 4-hydroxylase
VLLFATLVLSPSLRATSAAAERDEQASIPYGVDVSWPIHDQGQVSTNYPWLAHNNKVHDDSNNSPNPTPSQYRDQPIQPLGNRQAIYDEFMQGCHDYYTPGTPMYEKTHVSEAMQKKHHTAALAKSCDRTDRDRVAMMLRQPQSMQNYTQAGFQKIKCPPEVYKLIKAFWDANHQKKKMEEWFVGNT